jgi:hypothetical protein
MAAQPQDLEASVGSGLLFTHFAGDRVFDSNNYCEHVANIPACIRAIVRPRDSILLELDASRPDFVSSAALPGPSERRWRISRRGKTPYRRPLVRVGSDIRDVSRSVAVCHTRPSETQ